MNVSFCDLLSTLDQELPDDVAHVAGWLEMLARFLDMTPTADDLEKFVFEVNRIGEDTEEDMLEAITSILVWVKTLLPSPRCEEVGAVIREYGKANQDEGSTQSSSVSTTNG